MNELSLTSQWRLLCCAALEMALEKVTDQAEGEYARLKSLHGKVLCLQLSQLNWPLYLVFAKKIQVLSSYEGEAAVTVKADATTLYRLGEGESLTELIKQDKLVIEGNSPCCKHSAIFCSRSGLTLPSLCPGIWAMPRLIYC